MIKIKPFLKWVGGKSKTVENLLLFCQAVPFKRYFEPFLGGGALYLSLRPCEAILNDFNPNLIQTWKVVRDFPRELMTELEQIKSQYHKETDYYFFRQKYNKLLLKDSLEPKNLIEQAALFIFLNKNGFNGLYRVNSKGEFNVPWNKNFHSRLFDAQNLTNISNFLQTSSPLFYAKDFEEVLQMAQPQDLIYLDPPYDLLKKNSFTAYTETNFLEKEQERLAILFAKLAAKKCYVMLSNHNTPKILQLYSQFFIHHFPVKRLISAKKEERKTVMEVLITNFAVDWKFQKLQKLICTKKHYMAQNPKWYADLETIRKEKIATHQTEIRALKELVTSSDLKKDLITLIKKNQKIFALLTLIFATRWEKFKDKIGKTAINDALLEPEGFVEFLEKGGFLTVFSSQKISSLKDYFWGVEVGMDSNSRKNRTGKIMEEWVETILKNKLKQGNLKYYKQKKLEQTTLPHSYYQNWEKELIKKRWDFIVKTEKKLYLLECNYFDVAGSKIDAIIGQYQTLYQMCHSQDKSDLEFIWITDGLFWKEIKKREEVKNKIPTLLLLEDLISKKF